MPSAQIEFNPYWGCREEVKRYPARGEARERQTWEKEI